MNKSMLFGIILFFVGQVLGWFQLNSQYVSDWWKNKPIVAAFVLGVPTSIAFWYAWKMIVDASGSVWSARFIGSSTGLILFPILAWTFLGESMFTTKTMVCFGLALLVLFIQLYY